MYPSWKRLGTDISALKKKAVLFLLILFNLHIFAAVIVLYSDFCEFSLLYRGDLLYRGIKGYILIDNRIFLPYIHKAGRRGCLSFFSLSPIHIFLHGSARNGGLSRLRTAVAVPRFFLDFLLYFMYCLRFYFSIHVIIAYSPDL